MVVRAAIGAVDQCGRICITNLEFNHDVFAHGIAFDRATPEADQDRDCEW